MLGKSLKITYCSCTTSVILDQPCIQCNKDVIPLSANPDLLRVSALLVPSYKLCGWLVFLAAFIPQAATQGCISVSERATARCMGLRKDIWGRLRLGSGVLRWTHKENKLALSP